LTDYAIVLYLNNNMPKLPEQPSQGNQESNKEKIAQQSIEQSAKEKLDPCFDGEGRSKKFFEQIKTLEILKQIVDWEIGGKAEGDTFFNWHLMQVFKNLEQKKEVLEKLRPLLYRWLEEIKTWPKLKHVGEELGNEYQQELKTFLELCDLLEFDKPLDLFYIHDLVFNNLNLLNLLMRALRFNLTRTPYSE